MQQPQAFMYLSPTRMMLVSPHLLADVHQHAVMQFTCTLDGKPFSVWTEETGWQQAEAVLIKSAVPHGLKDFSGWQATVCIIPDARLGRRVQDKVLKGGKIRFFEPKEIEHISSRLQSTRTELINNGQAFHAMTDMVYKELLGEPGFDPPLDDRIRQVLQYVRNNIHQTISASYLASIVHLSEDRFLHLFKEQTGAPLRQYILWQRLAAATESFLSGKSAKEAAYEAGFSDPAHFSRTFFQMFGSQASSYSAMRPLYHFAFFQDE